MEAPVVCGGGRHRLVWDGGRLIAVDHPDAAGERLLATLGGPYPQCLRLVELWCRHEHDLRALTLGSRDPHDQPAIDLERLDRNAPRLFAPSPLRRPTGIAALLPRGLDLHFEDHWRSWREVLELLNLPASFQIRWGAAAAAHTLQYLPPDIPIRPVRGADLRSNPGVMTVKQLEQAAPQIACAILDAALISRARRAVRAWLGPGVDVSVAAIRPTEMPNLSWSDHRIHLALHHRWLPSVWGQGLTTVNDAFTLNAVMTAANTTTLHLARRGGATTFHDLEISWRQESGYPKAQ